MTRKLSRRHVLRGAGVALSLPWLEAMGRSGRARAATTAPVKRFMPIYFPNGASTLWWKTTGSGKGDAWKLSPLLSPFEPLKAKMLMIRQLGNFTWRSDLLTMNPGWTTYRERNDFCGVCRMPSGAFVCRRILAARRRCSTASTVTSIGAPKSRTSRPARPTGRRSIS